MKVVTNEVGIIKGRIELYIDLPLIHQLLRCGRREDRLFKNIGLLDSSIEWVLR